MTSVKDFVIFIMFISLFSACSPQLSPFTENLYKSSSWSDEELSKIQFYLSDNIVLRRQITDGNSSIISGKIKIENGKEVEEVLIQKGTPGVFIKKKNDEVFAISFEKGDKYLFFGPNPKRGGRYVLLATDWDKNKGKVSYNDKVFYTLDESAMASLLVDLRKIDKINVKRHTASGRKVN
ncbi:MAG: hypothetical protein KA010_04285 [Saprospiraceae bacterium]|nr:hypothetical protein [Saprospiraceae bacterium]